MNISASDAQDALTAIIKAFGKNVGDVEDVMDKLVVVGNNFPISVSQIAEGMNNAGSMLAVAGNSLEESIALLTAANTTTQDISKASTGLRTIAARIRKTTTELDELGEAINESKYEEMIQALAGKGINFTDAEGNYRSTYAILKDIAAVWNELGSMDQAAIIESLAGTRQQNVFASLITQFQEAERAMGAMKNSAGELQKSYDIYLGSIQAHVNQLKVAFTDLSTSIINSNFAKFIVDAGRAILEVLTGIIDKIGLLNTAIVALFAGFTLRVGGLANVWKFIMLVQGVFPNLLPVLLGVAAAITAISLGVKAWKEAHPSLQQLKSEAEEAKQKLDGLKDSLKETTDRIAELNALKASGNITQQQNDELAYLESQNKLLEAQVALQQKLYYLKYVQARVKARSEATEWLNTPQSFTYMGGREEVLYTTGYGGLLNALDGYNTVSEKYIEAANSDDDEMAAVYANRMAAGLEHINDLYTEAIALRNELDPEKDGYLIGKLDAAILDAAKALGIFNEEADGASSSTDGVSSSVANNIKNLTSLSDELDKASKALDRYNEAASGEHGELANKYADAYKKFLDDWNAGKTGSKAVQAAVELILPESTLEDLDYDLREAGEWLASDLYQSIFTGDGDFGLNFANYINEHAKDFEGIASVVKNAQTGMYEFTYESLPALAEKFNLSEDAVAVFLDALDAYGVQAMMSAEGTRQLAQDLGLIGPNSDASADNITKVTTAIAGLAQQGRSAVNIRQMLDSLASAGYIDLSGFENLGEVISNAVKAANDMGDDEVLVVKADDQATPVIENAVTTLNKADGTSATMYIRTVQTVDRGTADGSSNNSSGAGSSPKPRGGPYSKAYGGVLKNGGETLVNELGPELIAENGRAYIAGGGQPTMVKLSPGAIVLDADTTQKALSGKNGSGGLFAGSPVRSAARSFYGMRPEDQPDAVLAAVLAAEIPPPKKGNGNGGGGSGSGSSGSSGENWFEKQLAEHKHLMAMDKEATKDYLDWLQDAYQRAYREGLIDLKAYRQHEEEIYKGRQNDFKDHLSDTEHMIEVEKNGENSPTVIFNLYQQMLNDIQEELDNAYAYGLDQNNEYVQYLQNQWFKYNDTMKKAQDDATKDAESQVKDLVEYRIKMLKQYIKNEIDSLKDRLSYLKDFYSKQKEMLQDVYDTEEYLDSQREKRKKTSDIQNELQQLEFDDSAWAQKRKLELKQELEDAMKDLGDFEKQHALKTAQDQLDAAYEIQERAINARIDQLEEKLNDPKYLYEQALYDVQHNSIALYEEMIEYNNKYGLTIQAHTQGDLCE